MQLDGLQDDSEADISRLENELEGLETDIQIYLFEIKKIRAT